ncbi:MAG TPA: cytochrome c-type biogenesis CcmF C-terminal domain-containing protein [Solirubrobacteraceae bacterium]|jgi:cytochrome c-type biogenesis protein CcmF|nr:cytochrome c-type biogenesis CcmF C-terminal domain-containing protein [Solirubrobacteraceae bacterium]
MAQLGRAILLLDLGVCIYGIVASIHGARSRQGAWVDSGRRAVYALALLSVLAFLLLEDAFLRNEFSLKVVAATSSTTIPVFYKLTAPWSSQQGSLLLWVTLSSLWSTLALYLTRRRLREIAPYATAVLLGMEGFFAALACFAANPFQTTTAASTPSNGAGLDPLLMHPSMMIHPPMLYSGYTLMAIPFAFAIGALITGKLGSEWIRDTRRFALGAWLCLGIGIILGARWSYTELGWGGYWGWDAVEDAALMPWIVATAFIHSIQIQEKRGMLKVWNVSLVLLFGTLAIFGTFLVRSGVLDSIHAFGASTLGVPFVILLGIMFVSSVGLVIWRRDQLRTDHRIDSLISREAMFLLQNVVLLAITFVIFWITLFPLISQAITGTKVSVGPPAFTPFVVPLALILVLLTGVGPLISWRRATVANLRKHFVFPVGFGLLVTILLLVLTDAGRKPLAVAMFGLGSFVIGTVVQEFYRGTAARRAITGNRWPVALLGLVRRNRRRYGGYIAHLGFALMLIGVAASSSFQHSRNATLRPGQSVSNGGYVFHYVRPTAVATSERVSFGAIIDVTKGGKQITRLHTMQSFYPSTSGSDGFIGRFFDSANADSTIGLDAGPLRDIWTVAAANLPKLAPLINKGDKLFAAEYNAIVKQVDKLPAAQQESALNSALAKTDFWTVRDEAVQDIAAQYLKHPYPVQFLLIVSPLVTWLWGGALIIAIGGLTSLLPATLFTRRRRPEPEHSRVAVRELA